MTTLELTIDGMTCGHCVSSVKKALEAVDGVSNVVVELGKARLETDGDDRARLIRALDEAGYAAR